MSTKLQIGIVIAIVVLLAVAAYAEFGGIAIQSGKAHRTVGVIYQHQHSAAYEGLKQGMEKLGYGKNDITYDEVLVMGGPTFSHDVEMAEKKLIADNVDLLFVTSEQIDKKVLELTKGTNIPIVFMTRFHDPLSYGLINSYKSSGNNSAGVGANLAEAVQKALFFFKEINPKIARIGVFTDGFMMPDGSEQVISELKKQAPKIGISMVEYTTTNPPDATSKNWHEVADKIKPGEIDGLFHLASHYYGKQEVEETELATRLHIPHAVPSSDIPTGGSFSFGDDFHESGGQAAVMVDKIFNGTKPADIPIELGSKTLLILQLKRARDAGFTFPDSMLSLAEVKIEK